MKRNKRLWTIFFSVFIVLCAFGKNAYPVDLNTQVSTKPTIGSEISRGMANAECCDEFRLDMDFFSRCIDSQRSKYATNSTSNIPYELGLYFYAWETTDLISQIEPSTEFSAELSKKATGEAHSYYVFFKKLQKKLKIKNNQLIKLSSMKPNILIRRLQFWEHGEVGVATHEK